MDNPYSILKRYLKMFKKILIANRGEIAVRIIRACRELGIKTIAVFSQADRDSLHVRLADEAYCIGPPPVIKSYLNIDNIIGAAMISGADAVHPGYGFLAESSLFAITCEKHGLTFIGPAVKTIKEMGNKTRAREIVSKAGIPVVPGSEDVLCDEKEALKVASRIGYPVIIKACAGGGGRGMRVARNPDELHRFFQIAYQEAKLSFNDGSLYIEKFINQARHIEFQVLGDKCGNIIHLGERDCSIQRRNQKLIEESPCPALNLELREKIGKMAVKAAGAVGYYNAGTVEFLLDKEENFYFIEINARIQVEHPVTEMVTGIDLVKEQIFLASGKHLEYQQKDVKIKGWAIECRINAEDITRGFIPVPGRLVKYLPPGGPGLRVDSAAYTGWKIPPYYDSLICKLISWGRDREEAVSRMERALDEFVIEGVPTTIPFHKSVMKDTLFAQNCCMEISF